MLLLIYVTENPPTTQAQTILREAPHPPESPPAKGAFDRGMQCRI